MRRILPLQFGGFDLTPIALLVLLSIVEQLLLRLIWQLSNAL